MTRVWHKGPPPHVGWWNASRENDEHEWRWWNGSYWSMDVSPRTYSFKVGYYASEPTPYPIGIKWTDYYPENARVPRVAP